MQRNILVIGGSQVGKTTLAKALAAEHGLTHIPASEWVRQRYQGPRPEHGRQAYVEAITRFSQTQLADNPAACVDFIRARYPVRSGGCVIEGLRNPHDLVHLLRPERDLVIVLHYDANPLIPTPFEAGGIKVIVEYLHWLVASGIMPKQHLYEIRLDALTGQSGPCSERDQIPGPPDAQPCWSLDEVTIFTQVFVERSLPVLPGQPPVRGFIHADITPLRVWVRAEYLYDMDPSHQGQYEPGMAFSVSSYQGEAITFQVYLDNGGIFSYLPPSALLLADPAHGLLEPNLGLEDLIYKNCPTNEIVVHVHQALQGSVDAYFVRQGLWLSGVYLFTVEWHTANELFHAIALANGQVAFLPQHKLRFGTTSHGPLPPYRKLHADFTVAAPTDPVFAACMLVYNEATNEVLLFERADGGIALPAGKHELSDEDPLEAAARELREETGLLTDDRAILLYDGPADGSGKRVQTFLAVWWSGEIVASPEGRPYWGEMIELIGCTGAYPQYNGCVIDAFQQYRAKRVA